MFTGVTAGSAAFAESDEYDKDMRDKLDRYCEMSDQEKRDFISEHEKAEDHVAKMNEYCELDEVQRDAYIKEHKDEYKMHSIKVMFFVHFHVTHFIWMITLVVFSFFRGHITPFRDSIKFCYISDFRCSVRFCH